MRVDRIELQIMLADQGDFLKRLLHQGREGQPYWITARPTPEVLQKAALTPSELEKLATTYVDILNVIAVAFRLPELKHKTHSLPVAAEAKKLLARLQG